MSDDTATVERLRNLLHAHYCPAADGNRGPCECGSELAQEAADLIEQQARTIAELRENCGHQIDLIAEQAARLERAREALTRIMHARGNPNSSVTNMGRSMMREIAGEALAAIDGAKTKEQS